ncbi:MAG TPA: S8 family peptidase [Longimicrobium sp.]|nr:S8 family peptidase [Longimicrobium sp.]
MSMQFKRLFTAMAASIGLAACSDVPSGPTLPADAPAARQAGRASQAIPNRYIVVFKRDVSDAPGLARQLVAAHGGTMHHSYQHAIKGFAATLPEGAVAALRRNPNVSFVEQDQRVELVQAGSWGLDRVDQRDLPLNNSYGYTSTGSGVTAYIIDTGIETSHWEFGGRAWVGYDALGGNGQDCNGHGTHVAGTVGGANYGVAKSVGLVSVRVFGCSGGSAWSTIIAGVDWVRYYHSKPAVANMSLSGGVSQAADDAVRNLIAAGVTVAVAAGNNYSSNACYRSPARVGEALTVGSSNSYDWKSDFSNIGYCVDLFAPGEGITSAWLYGGTNTISGTSMASPHVAGAAALYLQGNPYAAPATVNSAVVSNATPNRLAYIGTGSPNLLLYTPGTPPPPPPPPSGLTVSISGDDYLYGVSTGSWYATATGGNGTYTYQWQYSTDGSTWGNVGTNSPSYSRSVSQYAPSFYLRVIVTSGGSSATSAAFYVYHEPGEPECGYHTICP